MNSPLCVPIHSLILKGMQVRLYLPYSPLHHKSDVLDSLKKISAIRCHSHPTLPISRSLRFTAPSRHRKEDTDAFYQHEHSWLGETGHDLHVPAITDFIV